LDAIIHTNQRTIKAMDFFQGMYATALKTGELITAIAFPIPQRAAYAKFKQPASRFALVGVFVAQTGSGARVAITGASNGVFRHAGLEAALSKSFTAEAVQNIAIDANPLNSDLHASAAYRANLIKVQTQRAVLQAIG
jgi:carbon-monoxide dehydrogenase medium subunit